MPDIRAEKLSFSYRDGRRSVRALRGLDMDIRDGEFVCVIGPSGCGKSTLLRVLAGLERPEEGLATLGGRAPGDTVRPMIVFQDYALFPWMSARKNISFALRHTGYDRHTADREAERYLRLVELEGAADLYPYQLSGGMKQRVSLARALAADAELLLLDEPFAALDARIRAELQSLLLELWSGGEKQKTVIFVTHDIDEALLLAGRVLFMAGGAIRAEVIPPEDRPRSEGEISPCREALLRLFDTWKEAASG